MVSRRDVSLTGSRDKYVAGRFPEHALRDAAEKGLENDASPVWPQGKQIHAFASCKADQSRAGISLKNFRGGIVDAPLIPSKCRKLGASRGNSCQTVSIHLGLRCPDPQYCLFECERDADNMDQPQPCIRGQIACFLCGRCRLGRKIDGDGDVTIRLGRLGLDHEDRRGGRPDDPVRGRAQNFFAQ